MTENIIRTEIKLSEESVRDIITGEAAKAISEIPGFMDKLAKEVLFARPKKRYSYNKEPPTTFEAVVKKTIVPMIEEEITILAKEFRPKLRAMLKKAFKANVATKEFENRLIAQLSKFTSNIKFYVTDD